ncbi:MAG TPA: DNA translocase FtsK [Firmicutes bacterium]|nr:DNA translocase FtsK [Bacillota bacterium]
MAKKRRRKRRDSFPLLLEITAIGLLALAAILAVSLWRGAEGMGLFGLALRRVFLAALGTGGSSIFVLVLAWWGLRLLFSGHMPSLTKWEVPSSLLLFLTLVTGLQLRVGLVPISAWVNGTVGGFVGNALVWALASLFGTLGTWVILIFTLLIGLIGATRISMANLLQRFWGWLKGLTSGEGTSKGRKPQLMPIEESRADSKLTIEDYQEQPAVPPNLAVDGVPEPTAPSVLPDPQGDLEEWRVEQLPILEPEGEETIAHVEDYKLPPLRLLNRPPRVRGSLQQNRDIYENSQILEKTLENFGIRARVVHATKGPAVTRYEIQPAPGTKISRVTSLADDIALNLACSEVRIEAPIPGKAAIGVEVPNQTVATVGLRDVLDSPEFKQATSVLTVALGKDITGTTIVADLAEMPHLLIAGATGSGKSVCINSMIASILFKAKPHEVRFLMVDPKVVELACYNGIPHLLAPVVNQPKKAAAALKWATGEMEKRYGIFAKAGVRDITRYNEWAVSAGKDKLPFIVIIIDELADLMMVARADVEDAICRLAQMARAAGMHLVIGTQRPSTDVITGLIKANIPSRISFAVSSAVDSRVILDMGGAEKLLGKGDMLFAPVGLGKPLRIQGAFVSNKEIEGLVDFVGGQMEAQYVESLCRLEEVVQNATTEERDELFDEAVRIVVEAGQASVSLLQRRLRVGYTRAARMIDQLEEAGVVGPYEGSKPRLVFKNRDIVKNLLDTIKRQQSM